MPLEDCRPVRRIRRIGRAQTPAECVDELARSQTIDAIENPHRLANELMRLDARREQKRYTSYLRCSGLHDVCPREHMLGWYLDRTYSPYVDASMLFTFEIGHAVHERLQNNPQFFGDDLLGFWRCSCGFERFGRRQKQACPSCGGAADMFIYREHFVKTKDPWRLTGHMDGLLQVGPGDVRVADFKTVNGKDFDALTAPLADHKMQVHGYMMSLDHDETLPIRVSRDKALLIYFSKQHKVKCMPVKAFHVSRDGAIEETLVRMLEDHKRTYDFIQAAERDVPISWPTPLPRCVASNFSDYRSKNCSVKTECQAALVA